MSKLKYAYFIAIFGVVLSGCLDHSLHSLGANDLVEKMDSNGLHAKKGESIFAIAQNSEIALYILFDGYDQIAAYRFSTEQIAKEKSETFKDGLQVGTWAFEYVKSPELRTHLTEALNK